MRSCPTCHRTYDDDELRFCLEDGTPLIGAQDSAYDPGATIKIPAARLTSDAPTEVMGESQLAPTQAAPSATTRPAPPLKDDLPAKSVPAGRKSSAAPWILGAAVALGLSAIAVAVIMTRNNGTENSQTAQANQTVNTSSSANTIPSNGMSNEAMDNIGANRSVTPAPTPTSVNQSATPSSKTPEQPTPTPNRTPTPRPTPQPTPEATPTPPPTRPNRPISGGVLNGKAISKPAPAYPAIAKAARASGTVTVQVMVDESGRVTSARAISGHPLLQQSAVQAAYQARFSPTLISGQPVRVTGIITYNFVAQ